jgi:hypothetical protein
VSSTELDLGFIASKVNAGRGIVPPDPKYAKRNARAKIKQQKTVRQKYDFVTASKRGQRYCDYFNPSSAVQLRVMGMEDTVVRITFSQLTPHILFALVSLWLDATIPRERPWSLAESDYNHAQQNRASNPPVRTPNLALPFGEARDTLMGPINTSVDTCRELADS